MVEKKREKTVYVELNANKGNFVSKMMSSKRSFDFSDIKLLRNLLSNEKARILYTLKFEKPKSIYSLAKILKRDFKSVRSDLVTLEKFGFIDYVREKKGNRKMIMPILRIDKLNIEIDV